MGFTLGKTEIKTLNTIEEVIREAKKLDSYGGTESEREDRERRENQIKAKVLSGEMTPFRWSVGHVPAMGVTRRVNGQHSSKVFLNLSDEEKKMVRLPVIVIYEQYECETLRDLATLFEQFDPPWSSRTREDLIGAHLANHEDLQSSISRYAANHATQGLLWYLQKVEGYRGASAAEQFQLIHENHDIRIFLRFCGYGSLNLNSKMPEMGMKPVVAAMFHTTRLGTEDDQNFWRRVSGGEQSLVDEESYEHKLAAFLDHARDQKYEWPAVLRRMFKNKKAPNDVEVFSTCIRVFSAYKKGVRLADAFVQVREQNAREIVRKLYPLSEAA